MWGRRRKRVSQLSKQLALGRLEDAMARAEQHDAGPVPEANTAPEANPAETSPAPEANTVPYGGTVPPQPDRAGLEPADVPVDNSAGPAAADAVPPQQRQRPGERAARSTRPGSLG